MIIYACEQRSLVWLRVRCGKITASNADRLLTPAKIKTFKYAILAETLTGQLDEHFVSEAMLWGIEQEERAIEWYAKETKHKVQQVGFCQSEEHLIAGCSPDLLVNDDGLCEIKCPMSKNHLMLYIEGPDKDYQAQAQFQMFVTGREWCDFVTFDPRFSQKELKGKIHTIERDEKFIGKLKEGVVAIESFVDSFMLERGLQPFEHPPEGMDYHEEGFL